jgi:hypothetical protein
MNDLIATLKERIQDPKRYISANSLPDWLEEWLNS